MQFYESDDLFRHLHHLIEVNSGCPRIPAGALSAGNAVPALNTGFSIP
jgi:hypothetical protein